MLNPIDNNLVFPVMYRMVTSIVVENRNSRPQYAISLTGGTPTMHACRLFLIKGGVIEAESLHRKA